MSRRTNPCPVAARNHCPSACHLDHRLATLVRLRLCRLRWWLFRFGLPGKVLSDKCTSTQCLIQYLYRRPLNRQVPASPPNQDAKFRSVRVRLHPVMRQAPTCTSTPSRPDRQVPQRLVYNTVAEDPGSKTSSTYDRRTPCTSPKKTEHVPLRPEASDPSSSTTAVNKYHRRDRENLYFLLET